MVSTKEQARLNLINAVRLVSQAFEGKDWRTDSENKLRRKMDILFQRMTNRLNNYLTATPSMSDIPVEFWEEIAEETFDAMAPILQNVALSSARLLGSELLSKKLPLALDWNLINSRAIDFVQRYTFDLVSKISETSRGKIQDSISKYFEEGWTREQLVRELRDFGSVRAERIAVTEVTRATAAGDYALGDWLKDEGVEMVTVWQTSNDEKVCDICGPRNGVIEGEEYNDYDGNPQVWTREGEDGEQPPAHVNCRCVVSHEVKGFEEKSIKYDPDQPRDEQGRWTDGGGGGEGASNERWGDISVQKEYIGSSYGQQDFMMSARTTDGNLAATLNYSVYQGQPYINMVEAQQTGLGAGGNLVRELADEYGYENIEWGMMTEDGYRLQQKLDNEYGVVRERVSYDAIELASSLRSHENFGSGREFYAKFSIDKSDDIVSRLNKIGADNIGVQIEGEWVFIDAELPSEKEVVRKK